MQKVIIPEIADKQTDHYLTKKGYEVLTVADADEATILATAPDVAGIMMFVSPFPNDLYDKLPNLKVLARYGVGYDSIDAEYAATKGVWVTNTPGANATSVAENAVTDMMMLAKQSFEVSTLMRAGQQDAAKQIFGHEITGSTVGIVGYGHIGQAVAKMLSGFGVKVLIYNRTKRPTEYGEYVDLETLMKQSDYVTLHIAATKQTTHLIGEKEISLMKPSASLINLARGSVVDEQALIKALEDHQIASAALDVFDEEPLPADSPFFKMDNVFLTPHTGSNTVEAGVKMALGASKMIDEALSGQKPEWAVNAPKL
ncbi:phosphoglycerate dehydrogenase [Lactobacillus sp. LC28-10]|uniref:Phosphoglycerate dehydrogenase n=1 Tax=Secundilactobacillus angelensis TaxID=2722706 RepID=A0ABX1KXV2_9LACO|nr:phosphoglycerate dehydrogenase [Secundilactobacillus angelensis]MCH5462408.1 phosphoglycerate dehydrogenase [Secundilactobacillus angelensis]NLR18110.1 phosphoglycerate dehydrogenase [Secundilactobacillus angelensis]